MDSSRRSFLAGTAAALAAPALPQGVVDLRLPGGPSARQLTSAFPGKGEMILQRTMPPLLETPMAVFNQGIITPNDRFFVRWHLPDMPTRIDVGAWRLKIFGAVNQPLELSLKDLLAMPRTEILAVNQCAGNSRGLSQPRVTGAQWRHGAMGNAEWQGVPLKHVLARAGVKAGAAAVRFNGMDKPLLPNAADYLKSLPIETALGAEPLLAFAMNGEQLPYLNGFPLRLVMPGWYSTYWIKMLDAIEVLAKPDTGFWMEKAYRIPTAPGASVAPGSKDFPTNPITRMLPRSWITSIPDGASLPHRPKLAVGGIALGGDQGVARVDISADNGRTWRPARLGPDAGRYSFRRFDADIMVAARGPLALMTRCTSATGETQPLVAGWNPSGLQRNSVETTMVTLS